LRIKITAVAEQSASFPFNYQHALQSAIYALIRESSSDYSQFLHGKAYVKDGIGKLYKFFTFSKLNFVPKIPGKLGFQNVKKIEFIFSTIIEKNMQHLILGIFSNKKMKLCLRGQNILFHIEAVDVLEALDFLNHAKFICLSPIAVSTMIRNEKGRLVPHFLNYLEPSEREHFIENIKKNLIHKYETLYDRPYTNHDHPFRFHFDPMYIARKNGKISKLIEFKKQVMVKATESPFTVEADPELIKIGYECGWGEKNSAGFGCVEPIMQ
jgi:CRISPR-associated endoribonuclease Cas6